MGDEKIGLTKSRLSILQREDPALIPSLRVKKIHWKEDMVKSINREANKKEDLWSSRQYSQGLS